MVIEYFLEWIATAPVAKRIEASAALVRAYLRNDMDAEDREDIEAALTVLLDDNSVEVRLAVATAFGAWKTAPRHVMSALAQDVLEVAVVVLSRSSVFHDAELVQFVRSEEIDKQIAISCRPWLSSSIVTAICDIGCEEACMAALANPAAVFTIDDLHTLAHRFGTSPDLRPILLGRKDLAAETRLLLINKVGEALNSLASEQGWEASQKVRAVVNEACDKASISFAAKIDDEDLARVVRSLIKDGRITVSYLLRAVCMGNIALVARAFSELSGVRFARVEAILNKDRQSALKAVFDRAGLPSAAFKVFVSAISAWRRLLSSGVSINHDRLQYLVTREVLEAYSDNTNEIVDELMVLLRKLSSETAYASARTKAIEISKRAPDLVEKLTIAVAELEQSNTVPQIEAQPCFVESKPAKQNTPEQNFSGAGDVEWFAEFLPDDFGISQNSEFLPVAAPQMLADHLPIVEPGDYLYFSELEPEPDFSQPAPHVHADAFEDNVKQAA